MSILTQFLLRLSFGLSLAMAVTSARNVTSGYFRVHLYVVLGLCTLATLIATSSTELLVMAPLLAALLSFVGSVLWMAEKPLAGKVSLLLIAAITLGGAWLNGALPSEHGSGVEGIMAWLVPPVSGLVLGTTTAAMLLGHWYLNTPTMKLEPLRRLIGLMTAALLLRGTLAAISLAWQTTAHGTLDSVSWALLVLRWSAGLVGPLLLAGMAWQTLKVPNTQSATGILYVSLSGVILGELTSELLSTESTFPL